MVSSMKIILSVAIIASIACTAFAIKCYQCDSLTHPECGVKFEADDRNLFDCSKVAPPRFLQTFISVRNATGCMKKTLESVAGHPQVLRSCYFGDVTNTRTGCQSDPSLPFIKELSCDVCTKDECNGASATVPIAAAILMFVGLARMLS